MKNKFVLVAIDIFFLGGAYVSGFFFADTFRHLWTLPPGEYNLFDAPPERLPIFLVIATGLLFWLAFVREHYSRRLPFWEILRDIFAAACFATLCDAAVMYMFKLPFARLAWAMTWFSALLLIPLGRQIAVWMLNKFDQWESSILLVGTGSNALSAWKAIESDPFLGYRVVCVAGLATDTFLPELVVRATNAKVPIVDGESQIEAFLDRHPAGRFVVALEIEEAEIQTAAIQRLSQLDSELFVAPPLKGLPLYGTEPVFFFRHEILLLRIRNNLARWLPSIIKRTFDLLISSLGLAMIAPFFIWLIVRIRSDGGNAIFKHTRIGQHGKTFECFKFRTMVPDSDEVLKRLLESDDSARKEWDKDFKLRNDPRITKIGEFLRKTSLDELPQLLNVLKGEMSLVGPRPIIKEEVSRYGESARYYFEAKPGITGLWQISGRNDIDYAQRVMLDTWYVQNWSLWHDIVILAKTFPVVFGRKGAY